MNINDFKIAVSLAIILVSFTACFNDSEKSSYKKIKNIDEYNSLVGKKIEFNGLKFRQGDSNSIYRNKYKVIVLIGKHCPDCIKKLTKWDNFSNFFLNKYDIPLIVITYGQDSYYFDYFINKNNYSFITIYDSKNKKFIKSNSLSILEVEESALLSNNNKISIIGSFINSEQLKELLLSKIKRFENE
jgi:hypothetical protein